MPDTDILNEEQVAEIEAINRRCRYPYVDALCRTVRAAWATIEELDFRVSDMAALREQLAQKESELKQWLQWGDRLTGGQHYLQSKMRYEIETQLDQVKEKQS